MSVIILILKIIGIILLVLLGLFLFLTLAVLFWPVGYRITGRIEDEIDVKAKLHWLCYLISFRFVMENGDQLAVLRIFGFPIQIYPVKEKKPKRQKQSRKSKEKHKKAKKHKKRSAAKNMVPEVKDTGTPDDIPNAKDIGTSNDIPYVEGTGDLNGNREAENTLPAIRLEDNKTKDTSKNQQSHSESWLDKLKSLFKKIKNTVLKIKNNVLALPDKAKEIFSKVTDIKKQFWDENNRKTLGLIYREILNLLTHYHPRKVKADISFSTGDPALTGQALGILSMIPFLYQKKVQIAPDFLSEKAYFKGILDVRGRIRMIHLIRSGLRIWKDENVKTIIKSRRA